MNQSLFLHIVERLEALAGKLPAAIQKPILHELTPMKELFLQQRPPRFLFSGSNKRPVVEILQMLFPDMIEEHIALVSSVNRWHDAAVLDRGTISVLDARTFDGSSAEIETELKRQPADVIFFVDESNGTKKAQKSALENLSNCLASNEKWNRDAKVIGLTDGSAKSNTSKSAASDGKADLKHVLDSHGDRLTGAFHLSGPGADLQTTEMMSIIARELPNAARIEMARISRDRKVQTDIAQILVKSTTAMCTAIGAQPIPLADLPILTTLQLMMVSGIMYVSGRERSLRAATEFVGALGANVGAGMLLREGTRAVLKFFPGWGNLICGMVAGAGTYAIGRSAIVYFLEGVSLKDARRTYLSTRKKSAQTRLLEEKPAKVRKRAD